MTFIKTQKIVRDDYGKIIRGSASIVNTIYDDFGIYHTKHKTRERLGKVISLSDDKKDKKSGVFLSPTRSLVEYDSTSDIFTDVIRDDERISGTDIFPETEVHTVFGDAYSLLKFLEKSGLISILRDVFPKDEDYERILIHIIYSITKDSSRISYDSYFIKSFA